MKRAFLAALVLGLMMPAGLARADEPVPIGEVVADPDAYHFRIISLQGTVRRVTPLPPYTPTPDTTCYGAYTFMLEDETWSAEISVLGICGKPLMRKPEVIDGEAIVLAAQILSPNRLTSATKDEVKKLRVIANSIKHLSADATPAEDAAPSQTEGTAGPEGNDKPVEDGKPEDDGRH